MKVLQIDETETQLVINIEGSTVAHVALKKDAENVRETLLAVLAEAPVAKDPEPEPAAKSRSTVEEAVEALDGEEMGAEDAVRTVIEAAGEVLKSPEAKKLVSFFERLPKPSKRSRKSG